MFEARGGILRGINGNVSFTVIFFYLNIHRISLSHLVFRDGALRFCSILVSQLLVPQSWVPKYIKSPKETHWFHPPWRRRFLRNSANNVLEYVQRNMVARSRKHLCHGKAKIPSISRWVLPPKGKNWFPLHYCRVTKYFVLLNNTEVKVVTSSFRGSCLISTKSVLSRQIFVKVSDIKFSEYPSSGSRADTCGQTDGFNIWVTVHPWHYNINNQLDATITVYW